MKSELVLKEALAETKNHRTLTLSYLTMQDDVSAKRNLRSKIEMRLFSEICEKVDEKGKAVHSNDSSRKAALAVELENNAEYQAYSVALDDLEAQLDIKRLDADESATKIKIYRDYLHGGGPGFTYVQQDLVK